MTRVAVPLKQWNKNWHDHAVEIAGGRVQVLDLPPDKAKEVADTVATTDGMIYHFYFDGNLPNGKTSVAQAVGHKPLSEAGYKADMAAKEGRFALASKSGARDVHVETADSSGPKDLGMD